MRTGGETLDDHHDTARNRWREDGAEIGETGKGTCICRRTPSGEWLLMIDIWSTHEAI